MQWPELNSDWLMYSQDSETGKLLVRKISDDPPVWVGSDVADQLSQWLSAFSPDNIWILADSNTETCCLPKLRQNVARLKNASLITIGNGEQAKTVKTCEYIWNALSNGGAVRRSLICNVGGGIVGDIGGFTASSFMRGIPFIQVPTSLLAMVDASVGGKTGVNFQGIKNLIGTFQQPAAVFIQTDFLSTLPEEELLSGFAEMVKHALIEGGAHWDRIQSFSIHDFANLPAMIEDSVRLKSAITTSDFKESGLREVLNLGHTTAHALESLYFAADKQLLHGFAVAAGLAIESYMAESLVTGLSQEDANSIRRFVYSIFPKAEFRQHQIGEIIRLMDHDKKNRSNSIRFSLLERIGQARHGFEVSEKIIGEALEKYLQDGGNY
jgi:3-dehydroquinate synthase